MDAQILELVGLTEADVAIDADQDMHDCQHFHQEEAECPEGTCGDYRCCIN